MKNTYVKPEMQVEEFLANQYVAACGQDVYGNYQFECNYPAGTELYFETNGLPGLQKTQTKGALTCTKEERESHWEGLSYVRGHKHNDNCYSWTPADTKSRFSSYHPCNKTHTTSTMDDFVDGYVNGNLVTIWTDGNSNFHATSHVGREHWTTQKS